MQFLLCLVFTSCILIVLAGDVCYPGACDPDHTCCETVSPESYMCCHLKDAVCCYRQIHCCPKGFICGSKIGSCIKKLTREELHNINELKRYVLPSKERYLDDTNDLEKRQGLSAELRYLDDINELEKRQGLPTEERYLDDINELEMRQGLPAEERYLDDINELEKRQGLPAEERYLDDINELEKRQGLPAEERYLDDINELENRQDLPVEERPFFQNRCDDRTFCPYDSTCCLSLDGTYGCCPYLYATCCPDKVHCCRHNEKCDATSRHCIGVDQDGEPFSKVDQENVWKP